MAARRAQRCAAALAASASLCLPASASFSASCWAAAACTPHKIPKSSGLAVCFLCGLYENKKRDQKFKKQNFNEQIRIAVGFIFAFTVGRFNRHVSTVLRIVSVPEQWLQQLHQSWPGPRHSRRLHSAAPCVHLSATSVQLPPAWP